jgi:hypothetical protein
MPPKLSVAALPVLIRFSIPPDEALSTKEPPPVVIFLAPPFPLTSKSTSPPPSVITFPPGVSEITFGCVSTFVWVV